MSSRSMSECDELGTDGTLTHGFVVRWKVRRETGGSAILPSPCACLPENSTRNLNLYFGHRIKPPCCSGKSSLVRISTLRSVFQRRGRWLPLRTLGCPSLRPPTTMRATCLPSTNALRHMQPLKERFLGASLNDQHQAQTRASAITCFCMRATDLSDTT
jgi:hypothetical protein